MGVKTYLLMGALAGLVAGVLIDVVVDLPTAYMRVVQVLLIGFGAVVAAFMYEGARAVTGGREPSESTDRPRRRWPFRLSPRRPRS
jgi:hypothetical protein